MLASPAALRVPAPPDDQAAPGSATPSAELAELLASMRARSDQQIAAARFWEAGAVVRWNEIARELVAQHRAPHTLASRIYALVSVAQYDALVATWNNKYFYARRAPPARASKLVPLFAPPDDPSYPSEHAAVAGASAAVLAYLFPPDARLLEEKAQEHEASRLVAGVSFRSDVTAGDALGRRVADIVIAHARADHADEAWSAPFRSADGHWSPLRDDEPVDARWGQVSPWLLRSSAQFRPPPPPGYDSSVFKEALAEVRRLSDGRTPEQSRLAALWADGLGSYAPSGRWNKIASDLVLKYHFGELRAARTFALLNMAVMDAGISAWATKYQYLFPRPSQADPGITTPVGEPNSPSYTCSHAAFSGAGAAVLGYLFPEEAAQLKARAEEATMSRVYGGIQYRFEGEAGLREGRSAAALAIARGKSDGAPEADPPLHLMGR